MRPQILALVAAALLVSCSREATPSGPTGETEDRSASPSSSSQSAAPSAAAGATPQSAAPPSATAAPQSRDTTSRPTTRYSSDQQGLTGSPPN